MTNLFIQSLRNKHLKEQDKIKARRQTADRIIDTSSKGNSYNWGVIQELKKDVAPTVHAVSDNKAANQDFLHTLKEVLGDRDSNPYYKRMLTIALKETLNKFISQIKSK